MTYEEIKQKCKELEEEKQRLEGKVHQLESQKDYWKAEHYTLQYKMKEREKNYLITNAEKAKRILEFEEENNSLKLENESLKSDIEKFISDSKAKDKMIEGFALESQQLKEVIDEAIKFIEENAFFDDSMPRCNALGQKNTLKLLEILQKFAKIRKGDNK